MDDDCIPRVVSHRNHFVAIEDYADMLIHWPKSGLSEGDRLQIMMLLKRVVRDVSEAMRTGAERGISQATDLILDRSFYEAKRNRRERSNKAQAEKRAAEEVDRQRRRNDPTIAEINQSMRHIQSNIQYHEKALEQCRGQIRHLKSKPAFLMSSGIDRPTA